MGGEAPKRINVANQAVADELLATTQVLQIQQEENYRYRDHVQLLGGEIDALKKMVEEKQKRLNKKDMEIADLEDTIAQLKASLKEAMIERSAFKVMEDQNADMLKRYQSKMREIEELERENKALKAGQIDVRGYADKKLTKAVEVEVKLNAQIQELLLKLGAAEIEKTNAQAKFTALQSTVDDLKQSLQMVNELRVEQMERSRMSEYKTLRRIDEISSKFAHERDEKDKMRETVKLSQMRGDLLEGRLSNALEAKSEEQAMVEALVNQAEYSNDAMRTREQILEREIMTVKAQLKLSQKAINDMIKRYKKLEGAYEEVKAVAARVHVGRQAPFVGVGRSVELTSQIQLQQLQLLEDEETARKTSTARKVHPQAPPLRAKTPKPPVPDPFEATKTFVTTLGAVNLQLGENSVYSAGLAELSRSRDDPLIYPGSGVVDFSRDLLDDGEGDNGENSGGAGLGFGFGLVPSGGGGGGMMAGGMLEGTVTATLTSAGVPAASLLHGGLGQQLPALVTTDGCQHAGKRNVLSSYLQALLQTQRSRYPSEQVNLAHFAITDEDFKMVVQYFRMMPLRKLRRIDLSNNLLTSKSIDAIAAWIISIAPQDLVGRTATTQLDIDLRSNQLSRRSIEKLGLKIRATPRPEVPLVAFEHDAYAIALYSANAPLLKIDARKNAGVPGKPRIKDFVAMGPSATERLPVRMPGLNEDGDGIIYPRDSIMFANTL